MAPPTDPPSSGPVAEYVFGYGSLSSARPEERLAVAILAGHRRVWNVAMDNLEDVPGYKYYLDPVTGERPEVFVTFANIEPVDGVDCVGFLLPIRTPGELVALDRRERNYHRVEVTDRVVGLDDAGVRETGVREAGLENAGAPPGRKPTVGAGFLPGVRVWTYIGTADARERFDVANADGRAVIQAAYIEGIDRAFSEAGLAAAYAASTGTPSCPVRELVRFNES